MKNFLMRAVACGGMVAFMSGCTGIPLNLQDNSPSATSYRDATLSHPNHFFQETPESRAVIAGSTLHATMAACSFIQRYRVATNADFTSTMNMFKNRAFHMGAERIVFVQHFEVDPKEVAYYRLENELFLTSSAVGTSSGHLSVLVGDLYDCPCNKDSCRNVN